MCTASCASSDYVPFVLNFKLCSVVQRVLLPVVFVVIKGNFAVEINIVAIVSIFAQLKQVAQKIVFFLIIVHYKRLTPNARNEMSLTIFIIFKGADLAHLATSIAFAGV